MSRSTIVTLEAVITRLNEALAADRAAVEALLRHRVVCNAALAQHEAIPVVNEGSQDRPVYVLGMMGLLNGVFGCNADGVGYIAAEIDEFSHHIVRFIVAPSPPQEDTDHAT